MWFVVRGSWFDKLTMRERGDERESFSATLAIIVADLTLPHGELVEPRTKSMQRPIFKKIVPTYPTPSQLAYSDGVLSGGNAPEPF